MVEYLIGYFITSAFFMYVHHEGRTDMLGTVLLVVLILLLLGALPTWPHSRSWGYGSEWRARA